MKTDKKLSVITICYNIKEEIERTCQSIVAQTSRDFEWVVIDGGSTDGTVDILNKYKDHIDVFVSEPDKGIYNAMNKGIRLAHGEWLNFMNGGDEFADKDVVADFLAYDTSDVDIVYGNCNTISATGKISLKKFCDVLNKNFFYNGITINHQASFIRHLLFDKYGMYSEEYKLVSDWEKWIVFAENNCIFQHWNRTVSNFYLGGTSDKLQHLHNEEIRYICLKYFTKEDMRNIPPRQCRFYLFNFLPFLFIKYKSEQGICSAKLFNFFPLYKIVSNGFSSQIYLFHFLPLLKILKKF